MEEIRDKQTNKTQPKRSFVQVCVCSSLVVARVCSLLYIWYFKKKQGWGWSALLKQTDSYKTKQKKHQPTVIREIREQTEMQTISLMGFILCTCKMTRLSYVHSPTASAFLFAPLLSFSLSFVAFHSIHTRPAGCTFSTNLSLETESETKRERSLDCRCRKI